jgi:hypothetical protein
MDENPFLARAKALAERGLGGISTLHLGPLDYNISTTVDDLRTAAKHLEFYLECVNRAKAEKL